MRGFFTVVKHACRAKKKSMLCSCNAFSWVRKNKYAFMWKFSFLYFMQAAFARRKRSFLALIFWFFCKSMEKHFQTIEKAERVNKKEEFRELPFFEMLLKCALE